MRVMRGLLGEGDSVEDDLVEDDTMKKAAIAQTYNTNEPCYGTKSRGLKSATTSKTLTEHNEKAFGLRFI